MSSRRRTATLARERLQQLSRAAYTATAGHLEVEPEAFPEEPPRRRWFVAPRIALSAVVVLAVLAAVVGARAVVLGGSPEAMPVVAGEGWSSAQEALDGGGPLADDEQGGDGSGPEVPAPLPAEIGDSPAGAAGSDAWRGGPGEEPVIVHVAGSVAEPGVVVLPAGSRVHDALDAAGGPTAAADLAAVNLARPVVDGEQIYVPAPGERPPAASSATVGEPAVLDLNAATADDLDGLPGIGPVLAGRIVDWRTEHGRFTAVEELGEVSGIGPALLGRLRDRVRV